LLLERAGDVVTGEEIREKLWPADRFVDFDHSLNAAVNKLREALGDSASSPRYVEVARRGYRFIAPAQTASPRSGALKGSFLVESACSTSPFRDAR
jgi:DNA-binding winged helix-turn-helix (wHTH) protein